MMRERYGYIDRKGKLVVEPKYAYGHSYSGELAGVTFYPGRGNGVGTGYINNMGQVVWEPEAESAAGR